MMGLSTMGSISFGCALVAGRNRVPSPAAGKTALRTLAGINSSLVHRRAVGNCGIVFPRPLVLCIGTWEKTPMAYVIAEPCIGTKDTACVDACPVDCIHPKKDEPGYAEAELLYIDPVECIDCGACVPVCPVSAIFALDDLPEKWSEFTAKNAAYYGK
jgi:ferredoxin